MKNPIIFTDLDGTLLDAKTYSFDVALPALQILKEEKIPLIICSSKTQKEIEYYRKRLDNWHPFISENGGGVFIPEEGYSFQRIILGLIFHYVILPYPPFPYSGGFAEAKVKGGMEDFHMNIDEAKMAKKRDFDEPFVFDGSKTDEQRLLEAIIAKGFNYTQGRFFHILGDNDKGKAVSILIDLYKRKFGEIVTIAIGDSPNDIPMLKRVDYPVIVQKPDRSYDPGINIPNLTRAKGIGQDGWNKTISGLVLNTSIKTIP